MLIRLVSSLSCLLLLVAIGTMADAAPVALVAHYTLDDLDTSITDSSGYGLVGTRGAATPSEGTQGDDYIEGTAAAAFGNSSNHSIDLDSPSVLDFLPGIDEFSISGWFKVPNGKQGTLFGKAVAAGADRQYQLYIDGSGNLSSYLGGTWSVYGSDVDDDAVHHVALSVGTSGATLYLDGGIEGTSAVGSKTNSVPVYIGARTDDSGYKLTGGWIDDVQFYRGTLTQGEAAYLHNNWGATIAEVGLLYRETFPNDGPGNGTAHRDFSGGVGGTTVEGWRAHHLAIATPSGSTTIFDGEGSQEWLPVNSSPEHSSLANGYYSRWALSANYIHWTEEFQIDDIDQVGSF